MKKSLAEIAVEVMRKEDTELIWYGHIPLLHEIYSRYKGPGYVGAMRSHPTNAIASVLRAVSASDLFKRSGSITHLGRKYPTFKIAEK